MIRLHLRNMIRLVEKHQGRKITMKDLAKESGCDKNALSRILNHPEISPSMSVADKLLQYFFHALKDSPVREGGLEEFSEQLAKSFIGFFPDDYFGGFTPDEKEDLKICSTKFLWSLNRNV